MKYLFSGFTEADLTSGTHIRDGDTIFVPSGTPTRRFAVEDNDRTLSGNQGGSSHATDDIQQTTEIYTSSGLENTGTIYIDALNVVEAPDGTIYHLYEMELEEGGLVYYAFADPPPPPNTQLTVIRHDPNVKGVDYTGIAGDDSYGSWSATTGPSGSDATDQVSGGAGDDVIYGEGGNDQLYGDAGNDFLAGGAGDDSLYGGDGDDALVGEAGNDTIYGGAGNDHVSGGAGSDQLYGGTGDDAIYGGPGADTMEGGAGNDTLYVSQGDRASGGGGDDTFYLQDFGEPGTAPIEIIGGDTEQTTGDTLNTNGLIDKSTLTFTQPIDAPGGGSGSVQMKDGSTVYFSGIERIICFTEGTTIETEHGSVPVEQLATGQRVVTKDNGLQPIRWIGCKTVAGDGDFAPIALDLRHAAQMSRPLLVSPQHRVLYQGYEAQLWFGEREVLIPAKHLVGAGAACLSPRKSVTYVHFMCDGHEIVYADGQPCESFHPGEEALGALNEPCREELFRLFPEIRALPNSHGPLARLCLNKREAAVLLR
jgi:hypothetical protein